MSDTEASKPIEKSSSRESLSSSLETPVGCFRCQKEACKSCWCSMNNYWKAVACFSVVFAYLVIGGAIFTAAERPAELESIRQAQMERMEANETLTQLQEDLIVTITNNTNLTRDQAEVFLQQIVEASLNLSNALQEIPAEQTGPIWDFASAVFFASTVITTIGYGTIFPTTAAGQILFIFYAIIGIPIALIFLTILGKIISDLLESALEPCTKRLGKDSVSSRGLYLGLLILVALIFFILIPAGIYTALEEWNYRESVYFCFVTLTTVGFGDFVPSQSGESVSATSISGLYKLCSSVWMWIGLAMIAALITEMQNLLEALGKRLRMCRCFRKSIDVKGDREELAELPKHRSPDHERGEEVEGEEVEGEEVEGGDDTVEPPADGGDDEVSEIN